MILEFKELLPRAEVEAIRTALEGANFVDGRETALNEARLVKHNRQIAADSTLRQELSDRLRSRLWANPVFTTYVLPRRIGPFHFTFYETRNDYGDHIDNAIMGLGTGEPMRSDLSMTLYLNDPQDYDGGELVLNSRLNPRAVKLNAGDAIIYPTDEYHHVKPVTRGTRKVAITWMESLVRSPEQRRVLADVWQAVEWLAQLQPADRLHENEPYRTLSKAHAGLLRLWSET